jgi:hypothetical protein
MTAQWKIFYGDSSTYSDADGSPYYAPRRNVQVIIGPDAANGRYILAHKESYWWDAYRGRWFGGDRWGEWDYLDQLGPRVVLRGRFVSNDEYAACIAAALTDPAFPPKTARDQGERW